MPGRDVVTSPGGTGAIWMPSAPNFMCTGLLTVAPFLGSTKKTRAFFAFAAGLFACAPAAIPNPATIATTSSPSCLLRLIGISFRWTIILASKPLREPAFAQPAGRRVDGQHAIGDGVREPIVDRGSEHRSTSAPCDRSNALGNLARRRPRQFCAWMFQQQQRRLERQRAGEPDAQPSCR